jgi:ammonia channel protein AmtB
VISVLGGLFGGALTTWLISMIFRAAKRLEVSGTVDLHKAVGLTGTVYLSIASDKPGKLTININGRLLTLDAVTTGEPLPTGVEARVTRVLGDGSVSVEKAGSEPLP